jgi:hypothetical protein
MIDVIDKLHPLPSTWFRWWGGIPAWDDTMKQEWLLEIDEQFEHRVELTYNQLDG